MGVGEGEGDGEEHVKRKRRGKGKEKQMRPERKSYNQNSWWLIVFLCQLRMVGVHIK